VVEHIHGGGEQHAVIRLAGAPADDLRQECFAYARIADKDGAGALLQKLQIEQAQDAGLQLQAALMVFEVEAVDGVLSMQPRESEAALNGRLWRDSSSRSTSDSKVSARLRFLAAASAIVWSS
jgi:hypothetical protein